ncbi:c-type cytochrome [Geotalea sp. SG265]|uniref:c-type cytochrome n=1 Tax=Geotalea sp. SG265 TaxID=2922867 RepID=UPI001FB01499|nr:c-type cytochrome [Geotalea sp. SG265]
MKSIFRMLAVIVPIVVTATCSLADTTPGKPISGKKEFEKHCSSCHANGGNTINQAKTLHKQAMAANGIRTARDIIKTMRNPGPGMTRFDESTISDREAKVIAAYVLKAFNK